MSIPPGTYVGVAVGDGIAVGVGVPTGDYVAQIKEIVVEKEHPITNASSIKRRFPTLFADPAFKDQFEVTVMPTGPDLWTKTVTW